MWPQLDGQAPVPARLKPAAFPVFLKRIRGAGACHADDSVANRMVAASTPEDRP